jgi:alpha-galactosidase
MSKPIVATLDPGTVIAMQLRAGLDNFPEAWSRAIPICFDTDWQGRNADPQRATEVRVLWTREQLFLRFQASYRTLTLFPDARPDGRRDHLWDRDVCEAFLQSDPTQPRHYAEFELSANGFWIDIAIDADRLDAKPNLHSGLRRRVLLDEKTQTWIGELAIPMHSLTRNFNPAQPWRANFFHVEGPGEPRFYSSWRPTRTAQPNFHVPEAFGRLIFLEA